MSTTDRNRLLARFHATAKNSGITGETYKRWLLERTGKESCSDLSSEQIEALIPEFEATRDQWRKVGHQCREVGFTGFEDPRFRTFVKRVTKVEPPQFLTKKQLGDVIAGLENWIAHRRKKNQSGIGDGQP